MQYHGNVTVFPGSTIVSFPIKEGANLATYWTKNPQNDKAKHAIIVVHGSDRDGYNYWQTIYNVTQREIKARNRNVDPNTIVVAPEFYSAKLNSGQYTKKQLAWGDSNMWMPGEESVHPPGSAVSSYDALTKLLHHFSDKRLYPQMRNITLTGHSGGGQVVNRYQAVADDVPTNVHVRFVTADPSTMVYFTRDRPVTNPAIASKKKCPLYNKWRYSFDNFTDTSYAGKSPKDYFRNFMSRDGVILIAYGDTVGDGDQTCMAALTGGTARRNRSLAYWKYINLLARTGQNMTSFPGNFSHLPNWHHLAPEFKQTLGVLRHADHNLQAVYYSRVGRSALFDNSHLDIGYRPGQTEIPAAVEAEGDPSDPSTPPGTPSAAIALLTPTTFVLTVTIFLAAATLLL